MAQLSQYIGDVYAEALQYTNDPAAAKEVTRRVMTLLKRSQEAGLAVNPSMARRLTEDCCREREYYENRRATFVNGTIADMPDFDRRGPRRHSRRRGHGRKGNHLKARAVPWGLNT